MTNEGTEKCKAQIKKFEGLRLKAYQDSLGYWTIGYGHYLGNAPSISEISQDEAEALFEEDFAEAVEDATKLIPNMTELSEARQAVVVDMAFNMGYATLKEFVNTIAAIKAQDYKKAANGMLASKWAKQVGKRSIKLSQQMQTGEWQ